MGPRLCEFSRSEDWQGCGGWLAPRSLDDSGQEGFASVEVFDFVPDIITFGKRLTSGHLPLGAVIISDRLFEEIVSEDREAISFKDG